MSYNRKVPASKAPTGEIWEYQEKGSKCGWATAIFTPPLAHTPLFFVAVLAFQLKLQLSHAASLWLFTAVPEPADCTGFHLCAAQEELQLHTPAKEHDMPVTLWPLHHFIMRPAERIFPNCPLTCGKRNRGMEREGDFLITYKMLAAPAFSYRLHPSTAKWK